MAKQARKGRKRVFNILHIAISRRDQEVCQNVQAERNELKYLFSTVHRQKQQQPRCWRKVTD